MKNLNIKSDLFLDFFLKVNQTFIVRIVSIILLLISSVLVARVLGPSLQGSYATALAIAMIGIQISHIGVHASNTYFVASNKKNVDLLLGNSLAVTVIAGFITASIIFLVRFFRPDVLPIDDGLLILSVILIFPGLLYIFSQNLLLGLQAFKHYNVVEIIHGVLGLLILVVFFLVGFHGVKGFFTAKLLATFFATFVSLFVLIKAGKITRLRSSFDLFKKTSKLGFNLYLAAIFSFLCLRFDLLMVKSMVDSKSAGYYSLAVSLSDAVYMLPVVVGTILFAKLSKLDELSKKRVFTFKILFILSLVMFLVAGLAFFLVEPVISLFYGTEYRPSVKPFIYLLPGVFFLSLSTIIQNFIASTGRPWLPFIGPFVAFIANVPMNFYFIPLYNESGAAIASSISYFLWFCIGLKILSSMKEQGTVQTGGSESLFFKSSFFLDIAEKQKKDQFKDWMLTVYPIPMSFMKDLRKRVGENISSLEIVNLIKSKGFFRTLFFIRKMKIKTCYIDNTCGENENIKEILLTFGVLTGARKFVVLSKNGMTDEEYSQFKIIVCIFKISLWTFVCFAIVLLKSIHLKALTYLSPVSVSFKKIEKILYLKTNLWFGVKVGGSVSHVAGVINGFKSLGKKIWFTGLEKPLLVYELDQLTELPFKKPFCYPIDLNKYIYGNYVTCKLKSLKGRPDVIYQRMSFGNYSGVELSRKWKCPLILEYNGSEVWISSNWGRKPKFKSLALLAEDVNLKHAHLIVTVSEVLADELVKRGVSKEKIVCYPNGVDTSVFDPKKFDEDKKRELMESLDLSSENKVFTFIGTFGKWHGVDILARVIVSLVDNHKSFMDKHHLKFLLVGDGSEMPLVREIIDKEPYSRYIRFTGLVPQKETPLYLFLSDVLLSPHVPNPDGSHFFGSPIKIFEYMAMGKPIIVSDLEQLSDLFKGSVHIEKSFTEEQYKNSTALLVEPGMVESLQKAILYIINHESESKSLGINARKQVLEKYTWEKHVGEIIKGFEKQKDRVC